MRYLENEGLWMLASPTGMHLEVLVSGTPVAPDPLRRAFLEEALAGIDGLQAQAVGHLE